MRGRVAFPPSRAGLRAASRPSARPRSGPSSPARGAPRFSQKKPPSGGRKIALYSKKSAPVPPFTMALVRSSVFPCHAPPVRDARLPASSQSPLRSSRPSGRLRAASLLVLSQPNPLRWASPGLPFLGWSAGPHGPLRSPSLRSIRAAHDGSALLKYHSAPEKSTAISLHHGLSSAFWAHDNSPLGPDDLPAALVFKYIPPPFSQQLPAAGASHLLLAIPSHSVCPSRACAYLRASPCQITVPRPAEAPPTVCTTR